MSNNQRLWNQTFITTLFITFLCNSSHQMSNATLALFVDSNGGSAGFSGLLAVSLAIAAIAFRFVSGSLFDRIGGKLILAVGGLLYALASLMYPVLSLLWPTLLLRFLQGVGYSAVNTTATAIAAKNSPPSRLGEGMSYFGVMTALGSAIGPSLGVYVWRTSGNQALFTVMALINVVIALVGGFGKTNTAATISKPEKPENPFRGLRLDSPQVKSAIVTMMITIPQSFIFTYVIQYGEIKDCGIADYFFTFSAIAMVFSRFLFGKSYDRYGAKRTLFPALATGSISLLLLCFSPNSFGFVAGAVLYGICYGVAIPILSAESVRMAPKNQQGSALAVYYVGYDVGIGIGALFWGILIDAAGYTPVILIAALFLIAAVGAWIRIEKQGRTLSL